MKISQTRVIPQSYTFSYNIPILVTYRLIHDIDKSSNYSQRKSSNSKHFAFYTI